MSAVLTKPRFFKPLIPGFEDEFLIPVSFLKNLKGEECDRAKLRSQRGKVWPVKINGRRFEDGWKQFVEDHDLQIGEFLVFRHEGDMVFDVLVLDRSTCQREYLPFTDVKEEETEIQQPNVQNCSPSRILEHPEVRRELKIQSNANTKASELRKSQLEIPQGAKESDSDSGKKLERKKKVKTKLKAKASSSVDELPNCVIKLSPDSIKKSRLYIPRNFARKLGLHCQSCSMILKDEEEKSWPATLLYRTLDRHFFVGGGWGDFRGAHKLKLGDSLFIQLIQNGETPVMKIQRLLEHPEVTGDRRFQNNAEAGSSSLRNLPANTKASEEIPQVAKESDSDSGKECKQADTASEAKACSSSVIQKRFFVANVLASVTSKLYIPLKFSRLHLENRKSAKVILLDKEKRSWPAHLCSKGSDEPIYIEDGWNEFRLGNNLKPGDSFVFELIENAERTIFKMCGIKGLCSSMENPYFYATLQASHFRNSQMKVPTRFARSSGLTTSKCSAVSIRNEMGNSWIVTLRLDKNNKLYMTYGCFDFVKENGLEEGDVFILELVKGGIDPEMIYHVGAVVFTWTLNDQIYYRSTIDYEQ
ncbi:B3 domain-containing protein REM6-like isoform X4 [Euphorbia lathyris]|uniref:B3 domain-containing protein REM6-like isoform X4 n=1 Tax=Euphorbia lathyris TaxID=212925 RepID=UPI003313CA4F